MPDPLTPERAQQILGAGPGASSEERHRIFAEKRALLEKKLGQAPTPGLQAKYRESIDELIRAFESLELSQTEQDLGSLRPDFGKVPAAKAARENGEVNSQDTAKPKPQKFDGAGGRPPISSSKRPSSGRNDFLIGLAAVILVLAALGGWYWKHEADKRIETTRKAKLDEQEAIVRATNDEAKKKAAEILAEQLRTEEEKHKEMERQTRVKLAQVDTELEGLANVLRSVERTVNDLKSSERDMSRDGAAWEKEYVKERRSLYEGYLNQLSDLSARHPARSRLKAAKELLSAKDITGAAAEAEAAASEWAKTAATLSDLFFSAVGAPLVSYVIKETVGAEEATNKNTAVALHRRAKQDEPEAISRTTKRLKAELTYLDKPENRPKPSDWDERMEPLSWMVGGTSDPDFARWEKRFRSSVTVQTSPADALVETAFGKGRSGYMLRKVGPVRAQATISAKGYRSQTLPLTAEIEEEKTVTITLEKLPGPVEAKPWRLEETGLVMLWVSPGTFTMGSPESESERSANESPQLRVALTAGYWLGKTEVTQSQWEKVMGSNPSGFKGKDLPVENVSWEESMDFCRKLTESERSSGLLPDGYEYTLPTEAQWEYACRAGTSGPFAGELSAMAWYKDNSGGATHEVGRKEANGWGFFDMHGNVWEWCRDWYADSYNGYPGGSTVSNPVGPSSGSGRVHRGGGWNSPAAGCRSAYRYGNTPGSRSRSLGFRLALSSVR